jgi:DNA-binding FadR family transcriptional regulator
VTGKISRPAQAARDGSRNLTFGLAEVLGRAIVTGQYDAERFPTEDELTSRYAVSRTVTREAVKMLTAKGLLKARPRAGTTVQPASSWSVFDPDVLRWLLERKVSLDLLRHFNELRFAIEPQAAALAAAAEPGAAHEAIAAGLARMAAAELGHDDTLESDIAFHIAVLEASANPFFLQFRETVATALRASIRFTNRLKGRTADLAAHRAVFVAIEARDAAGARAAMAAIVGEAGDFIATASRKRAAGR